MSYYDPVVGGYYNQREFYYNTTYEFEKPIAESNAYDVPDSVEHGNEIRELEEPTSVICSIIELRKQKFIERIEDDN